MDFKVFLSADTIELLDGCVENQKNWHFDAINAPMLINELVYDDKSYLNEYFCQEGMLEDELDSFIPWYLGKRQKE